MKWDRSWILTILLHKTHLNYFSLCCISSCRLSHYRGEDLAVPMSTRCPKSSYFRTTFYSVAAKTSWTVVFSQATRGTNTCRLTHHASNTAISWRSHTYKHFQRSTLLSKCLGGSMCTEADTTAQKHINSQPRPVPLPVWTRLLVSCLLLF